MDRVILHCDMNNFFASVELLDKPELRDKVVAVGGSEQDHHGVVLAKNDRAKAMGIKTGQTLWEARKICPQLIVLPPSHQKYVYYSKLVKTILASYTDQIESFGIDECWLDVTGSQLLFGSGEEIAKKIISKIFCSTGLTISVGISFCKIFAKLGSDIAGRGEYYMITRENFRQLLYHRSVGDLLGIGPATVTQLNRCGIHTIGQLAACNINFLRSKLGKYGDVLYCYARGEDKSPVRQFDKRDAPKSIGNSKTTRCDIQDFEALWPVVLHLAEKVAARMRKQNVVAGGVSISLRDNNLQVQELQTKLNIMTNSGKIIAKAAFMLALEKYNFNRPLRSVGIRGYDLCAAQTPAQLSFFSDDKLVRREEKLDTVRDIMNQKYGTGAIQRVSCLTKKP